MAKFFLYLALSFVGIFPMQCVVANAAAQSPVLTAIGSQGLTPSYFDMGAVSTLAGETCEHYFLLKNETTIAITIDYLQPSCGCVQGVVASIGDQKLNPAESYTKFVIGPCQVMKIQMTVDTAELSPGPIFKQLWVYSALASEPAATLTMAGELVPGAAFEPKEISFGKAIYGSVPSVQLTTTIDLRFLKPGLVPRLITSNPNIVFTAIAAASVPKLSADHAHESMKYNIALGPATPIGSVTGEISLVLVSQNGTTINTNQSVPITGEVIAKSPVAALTGSQALTILPLAQDFTLVDTAGKKHSLTSYRRRPVILFFYCGCNWCRSAAEMWGKYQRIRPTSLRELTDMQPVTIVVFQGDNDQALAFAKDTGLDLSQTVVETDLDNKVSHTVYRAEPCPRVFVIDRDGRVTYTNNHRDDGPGENSGHSMISRVQFAIKHISS